MKILGISAYYHDSAACLLVDGTLVAAAQEERFTRIKHDSAFPHHAARFCLQSGGIDVSQLDAVVFYDKPILKFERLLETYLAFSPRGVRSFVKSMPVWLKDKLYLKSEIKKALCKLGGIEKAQLPNLLFTEHHQSHAASAYYPSPFKDAAVLCLDGVGEWATASAWHGSGEKLSPLWQIDFPHSLGLLYSAFTYFLGFKVNSGEYKVMGLAPYGEPVYTQKILDNLIDIKADGSFRLNMRYFSFATGLRMTNRRFAELFGIPRRLPESELEQIHMDLARSVQEVIEIATLRLVASLAKEVPSRNLCLAGGVALNCVANGKIRREGVFERIWIQPAAGDAGGAVGAAYSGYHQFAGHPRSPSEQGRDQMRGAFLGPRPRQDESRRYFSKTGAVYRHFENDGEFFDQVAELLAAGKIIGWCRGPMEFGPRALGGRSIIGDPRNGEMQLKMNLKIKFRESFRPFAPVVLASEVSKYFDYEGDSPYMLMVAPVREGIRKKPPMNLQQLPFLERLKLQRSSLPAITHVDYSARIQTVDEQNPQFYPLLQAFQRKTSCPVLINTSFNVRGEPIVNTVEDAYRCFMATDIDVLTVDNYLLVKEEQPDWQNKTPWQTAFAQD